MKKFGEFYHLLLEEGVYIGPSGYEVGFVSAAHTNEQLMLAAEKIAGCLLKVL
jgi:glutamate-1-semialdehyde 2,1-aminomutase